MSTAKDQIKQILDSQPDDSSYDEIMREIVFKHMINKGIEDVEKGRIISNEEMGDKIKGWQG